MDKQLETIMEAVAFYDKMQELKKFAENTHSACMSCLAHNTGVNVDACINDAYFANKINGILFRLLNVTKTDLKINEVYYDIKRNL